MEAIWAYSGHYHPTEENFMELCSFLEEHHVDLTNVKKCPIDDDIPSEVKTHMELKLPGSVKEMAENISCTNTDPIHAKENSIRKDHGNEENCEGNKSVDKTVAFDLGKAVKYKWSTGVGPRIGCVRDYPAQLQFKALEQVNLSPRVKPGLSLLTCGSIPSPRPSPNVHLSTRLAYLGLVSPRV
ncbi:IQ domain-containing protein IQM1-like [Durio zibethinus]|uniref:IQ domain-containing protein IQM1-like n=1 Tax=Durio zibethinus TaxID=66656 RepID=A0A6P5WXI1_DURZI|nr:IQ domain-containing protein IQM1-like [Durio zibethinus]